MMLLNIGSDNLVELDGLTDERSGQYVNGAAVTMTLRDADLEVIAGAEGIALGYVADSNGRYQGTLPDTLALAAGARYYLDVTTTAGGLTRFDRIPCRAQYAAGN